MERNHVDDFYTGQYYEKQFAVSEEMGMRFAEISGDYNPIHLDGREAAGSRFGRKIVHGMLIGSYFSGMIGNEFPGAGSVYIRQEMLFRRPVYYDMECTIRIEVCEIDREKHHVSLKTQRYDSDRTLLVDGSATILLD